MIIFNEILLYLLRLPSIRTPVYVHNRMDVLIRKTVVNKYYIYYIPVTCCVRVFEERKPVRHLFNWRLEEKKKRNNKYSDGIYIIHVYSN